MTTPADPRQLIQQLFDILSTWLAQADLAPPPAPSIVARRKRTIMVERFVFTIQPAESGFASVKSHKFKVTGNGVALPDVPVAVGATADVEFDIDTDASIVTVDVDKDGKESPPSLPLAWKVADDLPLDTPGAPTILSHKRVTVAAPTPPVVTPTPTPTTPPDTVTGTAGGDTVTGGNGTPPTPPAPPAGAPQKPLSW